MKKDLKKFIQDNRAAFDDANPPEELWAAISGNLDDTLTKKNVLRKTWGIKLLKAAAVGFLVCSVGLAIYNYGKRQAYTNYSRISPELAAAQKTYEQLVTQKKDSIQFIATSNPTLYGEFSDVLGHMEASYKTLKQELAESPNKELTLEAMIRNLRAQIEVLSQQMEIFNYINETKKSTKNEQI